MASIEFKLTGLAELDRALRELPVKASKQIIRTEAKAAVEPWAEEMRNTVRRGPHVFRSGHGLRKRDQAGLEKVFGFIADNIVTRVRVNSDFEAIVKVGPPGRGFWAIMLEFGARQMKHRYPFVRPAFETRKTEVLDRYTRGVRRAIEAAGIRLS